MVGGLLYAGAGAAQSSKDYAVMARAAWSAYECSSLAGAFEDFQEQQRLFSFGYDQGKRFLAALEAKKVKGDDLNSEAPLVLLLLLAGPSADFMLGRIYSAAERSALDDVYETRGVVHDLEARRSNAKNNFWRLNCNLIGKLRAAWSPKSPPWSTRTYEPQPPPIDRESHAGVGFDLSVRMGPILFARRTRTVRGR